MHRRDFIKCVISGALLSTAARLGLTTDSVWADSSSTYDVVIIGGGLSGLTAAVAMKDHNVLVLEKASDMGGRIVSKTWEGFSYSLGASYIGTPDSDIRSYFRAIGLTSKPFPVPPPQDALAISGIIYPDDYTDQAFGSLKEIQDYVRASRELYKLAKKGIGDAVYSVDLGTLSAFSDLDKLTVEQWLKRRDIGPVVQQFINTENRGLFGSSNADLSLLYNVPEMAFNLYAGDYMPQKFIRRSVPDFNTYTPRRGSGKEGVWTFTHGMIEMVWAIENQPKLQGKLKTGADVQSVSVNPDNTVEVVYSRNGRSHTINAHAVVLASPAPVTAGIVKSGLSARVTAALNEVRYVPYVTMGVFMKQRLFNNSWNIACLDTVFSTLNDAIRTHVDYDYDGKSVLGIAMPPKNARDDSLTRLTDDQLFARAMTDVERYFPGASNLVIDKTIQRFYYGFPVFSPGYTNVLNTIHQDTSTKGPLFLAGDYTVYPTLGGAAVSGELAAERVAHYMQG